MSDDLDDFTYNEELYDFSLMGEGNGNSLTPEERWAELEVLRAEYKEFPVFLYDVVTGLMGFDCTDLQIDIAKYLQFGPTYRMIQAQRGQAKTTITAAYAVWRLIHNPSCRVLIISSGDTMATEIANWVIQILRGMPELRCMLPDKSLGDRSSVEAFDIHKILKGPEKSPSIACMGITGNMQGKRADVLIADDIESAKNSQTEGQRERLKHLSKDFTSICSTGDIIYLGTPQSIDSMYNGLISRGYDIRIWPGRYPTEKEESNYGVCLAPIIRQRMTEDPSLRTGGGPLGDRGKPTDPVLMGEVILCKKEIDQGKAYFQLQHMLDTRLMDADRFPLKASKLIFTKITGTRAPIEFNHIQSPEYRLYTPSDWPVEDTYYKAASHSPEFGAFIGTHMFIDPAGGGQNGDEMGFAITSAMSGKIFVRQIGGIKSGYDQSTLDYMTAMAVKWRPETITIEENYGNGAFKAIWEPVLFRDHKCEILEEWSSGQKELRIIDTLEPLINAGKVVMDEECMKQDAELSKHYAVEKRSSYSVFYQMARITRAKNALKHDDRLEALAGACRHWIEVINQDEAKAKAAAQMKAYNDLMKDPLGNGRPVKGWPGNTQAMSLLDKYKRSR